MNRDEIVAMATEAGLFSKYSSDAQAVLYDSHSADIQRFAALVAAKERESCAQECDKLAAGALADQSGSSEELTNVMLRLVARLGHAESAAAIRARGQKEGV